LRLNSPIDAVAIFDPTFASDRGAELVGSILDQARREPQLPDPTVNPTDAERTRLTRRHRIGPLVGRRFPTRESVELERDLMTAQLQLSIVAREICSTLDNEGIDSRILKGLATSELDYAKPSFRHTGDVDLLVGIEDLDRACDVLLGSGLQPSDDLANDGLLLKGTVLEHASGIEVDLHYRLSRFAPPTPADVLMQDPADLLFGLKALPAEGRLIHAAGHAVLSPNPGRRLSSVADIVAILDNTEIDWRHARALADEMGFTGAVGVAFRAEALIMKRDPHPGLDWPHPPALLRSMVETTRRRPLAEHWLAMNALPPGVTRPSYIAHRLIPSSTLVDERGGRIAYYRGLMRKGRAR
jgi:hypothetical protein